MTASPQPRPDVRLERASAPRLWNLERRQSAILAGILVATTLIYLPSLRNGWVFDDYPEVVNNKLIGTWSFFWKSLIYDGWWFRNPKQLPQSAYYRPLQNVWFWLNFQLLGLHPALWHLEKIALHLVAVILCFRIAQLLTRSNAVALLTAAIYGVMPAHVEAVVWMSAIPEPLSTVFELGALLCLIGRKPGWSRGMLSALALYACALLTHETSILFALIVAAYVFLIERGPAETIAQRSIGAARVALPFVLVAIAYLAVRLEVLGFNLAFRIPHPMTANVIMGWQFEVPTHRVIAFILTWPVVLLSYLAIVAVPGLAGPAHGVQWIERASAITFASAGALVILAAIALWLVWRSPDRRLYLFCAAWSALALAPAMQLNSLWALVQDRYLYAPSFGFSLALAIAAMRLAASSARARATVATATALLLAAYMVTAVQIQPYWHDDVTFFEQCIARDPSHLGDRLLLVNALNSAGDQMGAVKQLQTATALDPDDAHLRLRLAQQYQMMGRELDFEREFQKFNQLSMARLQQERAARNSGASQPASGP
jgi:protein O-mannosyl-transferase